MELLKLCSDFFLVRHPKILSGPNWNPLWKNSGGTLGVSREVFFLKGKKKNVSLSTSQVSHWHVIVPKTVLDINSHHFLFSFLWFNPVPRIINVILVKSSQIFMDMRWLPWFTHFSQIYCSAAMYFRKHFLSMLYQCTFSSSAVRQPTVLQHCASCVLLHCCALLLFQL